jgi:hypothetical protein
MLKARWASQKPGVGCGFVLSASGSELHWHAMLPLHGIVYGMMAHLCGVRSIGDVPYGRA